MAKSKTCLLGLGVVAVSVAMPDLSAYAQMDEIIVTSRKREESFLDVPVVSSVFTGTQLERFATTDFFNLADRVPGVVVGDNVGSTGANVTIRGIGSASFNPSTDGAVSVNVDGMQFSHGDVLRSSFFDVAQVEVLKGPQALFFGKNSPGGILTLRTADPGEEFETLARVGYEFEADEILSEAIISGPITDQFGARLAASFSDQKGFFENVAQPTPGLGGAGPRFDRFSDTQTLFGRLTLNFEPNEIFDARLKVSYEKREVEGDGGATQIVGCDVAFDPFENCVLDDQRAVSDLDPAIFSGVPGFIPGVPGEGVPFQDTYLAFTSLEINIKLTDEVTFTSVTGASFNEHNFLINGTFQPGTVDQLTPFLLPVPGSTTIAAANGHYQRYFTQEARLTSDFQDQPLNFMVGFFFEDGYQNHERGVQVPAFGVFNRDTNEVDIRTFSGFGQLIWDVTDTIEVAGGLRYTKEVRDLATFDSGVLFTPGLTPGPGAVVNAVPQIRADNVSPEATITWRALENVTVFGAYKEGFKSGSFNVDQPLPTDRSFAPEEARGGEIGLKAALLNDRLRVNMAGYYYKYDDLQVSRLVSLPGGSGTLLQVVNAASAKARGVEMDITYAPDRFEGLTLFGAFNYNKGEFDEFADAACYGGQTTALGCNLNFSASANQIAPGVFLGGFTAQDLSGQNLPRAPEWSFNFGFGLDRPIPNSGLMIGLSSATSFTDEMVLDSSYNPRAFQDSFFKTNASLRLYAEDESWELAVIGNNLNNEITASTCATGPFDQGGGLIPNPSGLPVNPVVPGSFDQALCFAEPGREVWIRATIRPWQWLNRN